MHSGQTAHTVENERFTPQVADLKRDLESEPKERQLPKLNVAGSIPVSRSKGPRVDQAQRESQTSQRPRWVRGL
jgi:hypothetical protein